MRFRAPAIEDIFHEYALDTQTVNDMTGGDLKIDVLPAGAVVPAFGLIDAGRRHARRGHGVLVYHYGKQNALALWGSGPGFAMDATCCCPGTGGGGRSSGKTVCIVGLNVVSFPYGPMATQRSGGSRSQSPASTTSRASNTAPSASRSTCSPPWAPR